MMHELISFILPLLVEIVNWLVYIVENFKVTLTNFIFSLKFWASKQTNLSFILTSIGKAKEHHRRLKHVLFGTCSSGSSVLDIATLNMHDT